MTMNQTQKKYARERVEKIAEGALREIYAMHDIKAKNPEWADVWKHVNFTSLKIVAEHVDEKFAGRQGRMYSGDYAMTPRFVLEKTMGEDWTLENFPQSTSTTAEGIAKGREIKTAALAAIDEIMLGKDGLTALEEFQATIAKITG